MIAVAASLKEKEMGEKLSRDAKPLPLCCRCGRPILAGQPHWAGDPAGRPWHYACAETGRMIFSHRNKVLVFSSDITSRN